MKQLLLSCLLLQLVSTIYSQPVKPETIEDSMVGWMKIYKFKGTTETKKVDWRVYTPAQLSYTDSFANWIQASYVPKGALGDVIRTVSRPLDPYNQYTAAAPQSYGAFSKTYIELKLDAKTKRLTPLTNSHLVFQIFANEMVGEPAMKLSTSSQYYFTIPDFEEQGYGKPTDGIIDFADRPSLKKYPTYFQRNSVTGNQRIILLSKDQQLPFVKVTKGEYLKAMEDAVMTLYKTEKKKIAENPANSARNIEYFTKYLDDNHQKRLACLKANQEKYKSRHNEVAEIFTDAPDAMLENIPDIFEGSGGSAIKLPVYKVDPVIAEKCKKEGPQWIIVRWTAELNTTFGKHLYESVINNFDFDYLYKFCFDRAALNGRSYKPLKSPIAREAIQTVIGSESSTASRSDKSIHFFDDFSTTPISKKPVGWKSTLAPDGSTPIVMNLEGLMGNWLMMNKDYSATPLTLKKPLPQDFTISYDLIASEGFKWGGKGLTFVLAKETSPGNRESLIDLKLRPGFDGRSGEITLETKFPFPPGYSNGSKWYEAPGFSNTKTYNRVSVRIQKSGEQLRVWIDDKQIVEIPKAIPATLLFNSVLFTIRGTLDEKDRYYIGNFKITNGQ